MTTSTRRAESVRNEDATAVPDYVTTELDVLCYLVERGKPAAMVAIKTGYMAAAQRHVSRQYGLQWQARKLSAEWDELWIYKYPHIGRIIAALPANPETDLDHWMLGKLFGYEEAAIGAFLGSRETGASASGTGRESV